MRSSTRQLRQLLRAAAGRARCGLPSCPGMRRHLPHTSASRQSRRSVPRAGSCPTPDTLASALPKAFLSTPKGWSGVSVTPASASVSIGSTPIATVSVTGLQVR